MALSDFTPEQTTIPIGNTSITVRGLSLVDISSLMRTHLSDLEAVIELYEKSAQTEGLSSIALGKFAIALVKDAPGLVAHMIALAADEPAMTETASRIKILDQIKLLKAIGALTFEEVGGVKKLMGEFTEMLQRMRPEPTASLPA